MIGRVLAGRYKILETLGGGGMAVVYKGQDLLLNRYITIKILRPEFTSDEEFVERFKREAKALASLSHPNIVNIYDVGQEDNTYFLVMEYVEGKNLKEIIREKNLGLRESVRIVLQVALALGHAHQHGILHRDVKPQNIIITPEGIAKLTDFGIAGNVTSSTINKDKEILGSVHYLSPEQAKGESLTFASDLYSLGVVFYELVTKRLPFTGDSPIAVALKQINDLPKPPSSYNKNIPDELDRIILKLLSKKPEQRYKSAYELIATLKKLDLPEENFAEDSTMTIILDKNQFSEVRGKKRLKTSGIIALVALFLALIGGLGYFLYNYFNVKEAVIPEVRGLGIGEAKRKLEELGFTNIIISSAYHETVPKDKVISIDPLPGERVKVVRPIYLVVSKGKEMVLVPDVREKDIHDARVILENAGLKVGEINEIYDERLARGTVIEQDPEPNTEVEKGYKIKLILSKGAKPAWITVPDLRGKQIEEARKTLQQVKLVLDDTIKEVDSTEYFAGQVVTQNPLPGSLVEEGSKVRITVSRGPGPVRKSVLVTLEVPNDGQKHSVKIVVKDVRPSEVIVYANDSEEPGTVLEKEVYYYGKGRIKVYLDAVVIEDKEVN
ncbi:protein kinase domain-containing protein [Carboxydothermus ferrireducens]|uniref:non-specific serine/threonine protein kinase n=1 Tax=Carboxydothermus ferrireducens DSM 11255 TaxID=1119529 RepID=A0ABX2RAP0_9THEO|nr:PASTA domain-containing protein [Carboxydothermus ferrireducens]NYE58247.1 serine/threonine-protein kinase [Carboxydothermus ferrireducens DSM 11255]